MLTNRIYFYLLLCFTPIGLFSYTKFPESQRAHAYLDGLRGLEIGGSAHNPFGLKTLNIDYTDSPFTFFKQTEISLCGTYLKVDLVAPGDRLPFKDNTWDFVVSSHVIQYFYDPIRALKEWLRVVKPGGYVFIIAPHKERTFEWNKPRTSLSEIVERHNHPNPIVLDQHAHHCVWTTQDFLDICEYYHWNVLECDDIDDKVGNGFMVILKK